MSISFNDIHSFFHVYELKCKIQGKSRFEMTTSILYWYITVHLGVNVVNSYILFVVMPMFECLG